MDPLNASTRNTHAAAQHSDPIAKLYAAPAAAVVAPQKPLLASGRAGQWIVALAVSFAMVATSSVLEEQIHCPATVLMVFLSATWAAMDSKKIALMSYRTRLAGVPLWIACVLLWIVFFPWYLVVRHQIAAGQLPRN